MSNHDGRPVEPPLQTRGVKTLLGNPKKAIIKLSIPMIVAMSMQTLYSIVDAIWVSGLGPDALAAVGFFFPFHYLIIALAAGLGVGGSSAVSRRIGAHDKAGADAVAAHVLALMAVTAAVLMLPALFLIERVFVAMGAGPVSAAAGEYSRIIFGVLPVIFFAMVASALLRGEGDVKRAMVVMILGSGLNIILDPIFIYGLKWGVSGAAWATAVSLCFSTGFLFYWLFIKKDTYITIGFRGFRFRRAVLKDILSVGIPASIQQTSMSFAAFLLNLIVVRVGGTDGVAIYTTGWRVVMFAALPLIGIATAVVSVTGAAYGGHDFEKLRSAYLFAVQIGVLIEMVVASLTYLLAPQLAGLFTMSAEGFRIKGELIILLRIFCFFYPAASLGMLSSSMFQGTGKGVYALIVTFIRTIIMVVPLAFLLSSTFDLGLIGVWWGITAGNITGALIAFSWGWGFVGRLNRPGRTAGPEFQPGI